MKQNIAIIIGGYSIESQISLKSGEVVYENLPDDKYNSYLIHIEKDEWFYKAPYGRKI
jgi:D-alanine-D-alanine ligase